MSNLTAKEVKDLYKLAFPFLVSPPECKDRRYGIYSIEVYKKLLNNSCPRHHIMIFSDEISDCDDFVLQAYSEFKWFWGQTSKDGDVVVDGKKLFIRKHQYHAPVGMAFGIKFRGRMVKHSVMSLLAVEGMYIYDAVSREFYKTDTNQDIVLHVSMQ